MEPGKPAIKSKGTESTRTLGGFWAVSEYKGDFMGTPFAGVMTVGYDAEKKKYVGTWVCSMCDRLSKYEGSVDGKTLTSYASLKTDITNAGGNWVDQEVKVCPANEWTLITSRDPGDLEAFVGAIKEQLSI